MSDLKVEVLKIEEVCKHPNADRLDLATVLGYQVVVGRDQYKVGDSAVYFPVDSLLPGELQDVIFANSQMKLSRNRVRAARIRGAMSFGLLVEIPKIKGYLLDSGYLRKKEHWKVGKDLRHHLKVTKHEPPVKGSPQEKGKSKAKKYCHPQFHKYTDIQHGKRNWNAWENYEGEVVLTEKIHGTNFRCGWLPKVPRTWWGRVKAGLTSFMDVAFNYHRTVIHEFCYGSHNVQLQDGNRKHGKPAHENVYKRAVKKYSLKDRIKSNEVWYFEIFGDGIQTNYSYGLKNGEFSLRVIDIKKDGEYLPWLWVEKLCRARGMMPAPILMHDTHVNINHIHCSINGHTGTRAARSKLDHKTPVEGGVLRPFSEEKVTYCGRMVFKFLSDEYLLNKSNSDFH